MIGNHYLKEGQIQALRPRVTFTLAHIWQVERVDGVVMRFASHDKWIEFGGQAYGPVGPNASDMEQREAGGESDFEVMGFLSATSIKASDIHANRYHGCKIVHHVIDWQRPWIWFRKHVWWIRSIVEDNGIFRAQVQGVERWLTIPAGRFYERECDKVLGSLECGAVPRTLFGASVLTIASAAAPVLGIPHNTMAFTANPATWTWSPAIRDGLLTQGKVKWTSGPNTGMQQTIAEHVGTAIALESPTPFPIHIADQFAVFSGCNGSISACEFDYANRINFGGQWRMPSTEDIYRKPLET